MHLLFMEFRGPPPPHDLVIHLGGNDLGLVKGKALVIQAKDDFQEISRRWPGTLIVWSAIIPRHTWRATLSVGQADRAWRNANRELRKALVSELGQYISHPELRAEELRLYCDDGVHLSEEGLDIFFIRSAARVEVGPWPFSGGKCLMQ